MRTMTFPTELIERFDEFLAAILATFNEAMKENSLTTSSFTVTATGGGLVSGNVTGSETSVVFTPMSQLQGSTQYTATLST